MYKKKWNKLVAGIVVAFAAFTGYGAVMGNNLAAATCTNNDIIHCGVTSQSQLATKYNEGDIGAILGHYGVSSGMVAAQNAVLGAVTIDGNVIFNGQVIATGAESVGREWVDGSTAVKIGSTTVYQRATSAIFKQHDLAAYIYRDSNGQFLAAVLTACGNPVAATPKPAPVEKVWVCDTDTGVATQVDKSTVTDTSTIVNSQGDCHIAQVKVCDTTTNPWTIKMVDKDKVQSGQKIIAKDSECVRPPKMVLVCDTTTGTVAEVDETKVPNGSKVVAKAEDCTKTEYVWVCDTSTWTATKVDKTKVTSSQTVVASADQCVQVWVCNTDTGVATHVAKYDLKTGDKVVANAEDCKKPIVWVLVCNTDNWRVTKVDKTKVQAGQRVIANASDCSKPAETENRTCTITCQPRVEVNQNQTQNTVVYQSTVQQPVNNVSAVTAAAPTTSTQATEFPHTGPAEVATNGIGLASLTGAGYAYIASRRKL